MMFTHKRTFDCAACSTPVLIRRITHGHLLKCDCGEQFTSKVNPELMEKLDEPIPTDFIKWTMTWDDNGPQDAVAYMPKSEVHVSKTELWGLLNYAEMHDDGYNVTYKGEDVFGRIEPE